MFIVCEYIPGGDLTNLIRNCVSLDLSDIKFYAAEVVAAISILHEQTIIYRDLKPENILLDEEGHIKLIDFGFAKKIGRKKKTHTNCGTAGYMAPEILRKAGHSYEADIWGIGILICELIGG